MRRTEKGLIRLNSRLLCGASVVGKKEREGPLGELFDLFDTTDRFGCKTWEGAESEMQRLALNTLLNKADLRDAEIDALFAGDLLNQCVGSAYGLLPFDVPYFGLYGACSTSAEGLLLASIAVSGGICDLCAVVTSSHNCSAERQFRSPLEYGAQRTPTAQWTVTGAGAFLVGRADAPRTDKEKHAALIRRGCVGKVVDAGVNDSANMGAAMAPAAANTLLRFFSGTGERPENYDRIVTGDLGREGGTILCDLTRAAGCPIAERYEDCGRIIFDRDRQDVHSGGSGCGCAATVLASHFLPAIRNGEIRRMLFLATGAMMSPDSLKQGKNIPAVAHLVELERG